MIFVIELQILNIYCDDDDKIYDTDYMYYHMITKRYLNINQWNK